MNECITRALLATIVACGVFAPRDALAAQPEVVEPSETQLDLNQTGFEAIAEGDYERAIRIFQTSLDVGPLNITHANLGRAYQRAGDCEQAEHHYRKALEAPAIPDPSPAEIADAIARYRAELHESCPGKLELRCEPAAMRVLVDGELVAEHCPATPQTLTPGTHVVTGVVGDATTEHTVEIEPMQTTTLTLALDAPPPILVTFGDSPTLGDPGAPPPSQASVMNSLWPFATAAALIAGGVLVDTQLETSNNYNYDHLDVAAPAMYGAAIGLIIWGIMRL